MMTNRNTQCFCYHNNDVAPLMFLLLWPRSVTMSDNAVPQETPAAAAAEAPAKPSMAALRLDANKRFTTGDLGGAATLYEQCVAMLDEPADAVLETKAQRIDEALKCYGNLCTVRNKMKQRDACLAAALAGLRVSPVAPKPLAFRGMCEVDAAAAAFDAATTLEEQDAAVDGVMEGFRWAAAASLLAPNLTGQLAATHERFVQVMAKHCGAGAGAGSDCRSAVSKKRSGTLSGTGVVAEQRVPMNGIVADMSETLCVGYYADSLGKGLCVACATPKEKCIECPQCRAVCYCSEACSARYAARHAQHECAHFCRLQEMLRQIAAEGREAPEEVSEMASHVITALSCVQMGGADAELLLGLDHHSDEVTQSLGMTVPLVLDLLQGCDEPLVRRLCGVTRCNAVQLSDESGLGLGQAVFGGVASLFNHSCTPNAVLDPDRRTVRALRTIRPGEEVLVSYTPQLYLPRSMRQTVLSERFFFTCRCGRCSNDVLEPLVNGVLPTGRSDATEYFRAGAMNLAESIRLSDVDEVSVDQFEEVGKLQAELSNHLLPTHGLTQELRNSATFVCSVLGRHSEVAMLCREERLLWEMLVPGAVPVKVDKLRNVLAASGSGAAVLDGVTALEATMWKVYAGGAE